MDGLCKPLPELFMLELPSLLAARVLVLIDVH